MTEVGWCWLLVQGVIGEDSLSFEGCRVLLIRGVTKMFAQERVERLK